MDDSLITVHLNLITVWPSAVLAAELLPKPLSGRLMVVQECCTSYVIEVKCTALVTKFCLTLTLYYCEQKYAEHDFMNLSVCVSLKPPHGT